MPNLPPNAQQAANSTSAVNINPNNTPPSLKQLASRPGARFSLKNKLLLILALVILVLAIGSLLIITLIESQSGNGNNPLTQPTPTVNPDSLVPTQAQIDGQPTEYYNDPEILQLDAVIQQINAQIDTEDLREPEIDPPDLETGISF